MPCGFLTGCADSRRVVRIDHILKSPKNRLLGLKIDEFKPIRQKIPMTNPHNPLRIRTEAAESTNIVQNPHGLLKIRTAASRPARLLRMNHASSTANLTPPNFALPNSPTHKLKAQRIK